MCDFQYIKYTLDKCTHCAYNDTARHKADRKIKGVCIIKVSELVKILRENGCRFIKHGGEHDEWASPTGKKFRIPRHPSKEIPKGTLNKILKDAGLK